jgi:hypothetical protein
VREDDGTMAKSMKPGGGGRFAALTKKLAARGDVKNPKAVAAAIGRKKWGSAKMAKWSAAGRARAAKS